MIPPWPRALEHAASLLAAGGRLHVVDFGQQERAARAGSASCSSHGSSASMLRRAPIWNGCSARSQGGATRSSNSSVPIAAMPGRRSSGSADPPGLAKDRAGALDAPEGDSATPRETQLHAADLLGVKPIDRSCRRSRLTALAIGRPLRGRLSHPMKLSSALGVLTLLGRPLLDVPLRDIPLAGVVDGEAVPQRI